MPDTPIKLYALSTCGHCKSTKKLLEKCGVDYDCVEVDLTKGDERQKLVDEIKMINPKLTFPTLVVGEKIIVGYRENEIKEALGK